MNQSSPVTERLRQFAAYGDTAEGRILAQLALTEIERLRAQAATPMRADIEQIISDGWRNGKSSAEVADAVLVEFGNPAQGSWQPMSVLPDVGRKFICLYDDGSGAVMCWRHNDGYIDQDGDDCNLERGKYDRWAYLPDELEFYCETRAEDPMCLTIPSTHSNTEAK
jgi:hypothetical protein